jgi:hypothetical protein
MAHLHPSIFTAFHDVRHEAVYSLIIRLFINPASTTSSSISLRVEIQSPPRPNAYLTHKTRKNPRLMPHTTPSYSAQFVFIGTALRGERAPKCLKHYFRLNTLPFDAKSPWRIPYDELPPLVSGVSSLRWQKWKEPGPGEGVNMSILPSARFLQSGEDTRSAPWAKWNTDVIVICVFLEDSVTTEKRLQQVRACVPACVSALPPHSFLALTRPLF